MENGKGIFNGNERNEPGREEEPKGVGPIFVSFVRAHV